MITFNICGNMKRSICVLLVLLSISAVLYANNKKEVIAYTTIIYTDKTLAQELVNAEKETRGFGEDILASMGNAAIGVATGYISSIADFGIQAIGQLILLDRKHKQEWQETVAKECVATDKIGTLYALNDFYTSGSSKGAMDPTGLQFNGIGCLAKTGNDTAFYISCHLNREKLDRILNHSKFELTLDTLILNPYRAHLPNTQLPISFSFAERKTFDFKVNIQIISSWMDFIPALHKDEVLGEFIVDVPIDSTDVDERGFFVYVRQPNEEAKYNLTGESFIVPRSYMQVKQEPEGNVIDHFGTGQYSLNITIEETCEVTPEYQKNWRKDRKYRKQLMKDDRAETTFDGVCKTITSQTWDESLQAWVVTIMKAPVDYSIKTLDGQMRMSVPK